MQKISVLICCLVAGLSLVLTTNNVQAGTITGVMAEFSNPLNEWTAFQMNNNPNTDPGNPTGGEDYVGVDGEATKVGPGYGGQIFDAEYLFYKRVGNTLSLGLQTGFNLTGENANGVVAADGIDGPVKAFDTTSNIDVNYYAGDLALSFDGPADAPGYFEYAVDFGLYTEDFKDGFAHGDKVGGGGSGIDAAGLYKNVTWNNDVIPDPDFQPSDPFAMETGDIILEALTENRLVPSQTQNGETSYARIVSFDLGSVGISSTDDLTLFVHWTMSCGNDEVNGYITEPAGIRAPVPTPEPATIALFGIGLAGLAGGAARRRFKKQKQL